MSTATISKAQTARNEKAEALAQLRDGSAGKGEVMQATTYKIEVSDMWHPAWPAALEAVKAEMAEQGLDGDQDHQELIASMIGGSETFEALACYNALMVNGQGGEISRGAVLILKELLGECWSDMVNITPTEDTAKAEGE